MISKYLLGIGNNNIDNSNEYKKNIILKYKDFRYYSCTVFLFGCRAEHVEGVLVYNITH